MVKVYIDDDLICEVTSEIYDIIYPSLETYCLVNNYILSESCIY